MSERPATRSLWNYPDSTVRLTYRSHLWMYLLTAPAMALIRYAPFLAVKTYDAAVWVPILAALMPASHLLAVFFAGPIARQDKTAWVVRPSLVANLAFGLIILAGAEHGWLFALAIILTQAFRAPIIAAQSAIFRTNYPPEARSSALSIPMAIQYAGLAVFARAAGRLFDESEGLIVPVHLLAGVLGIAGALVFARVRTLRREGEQAAGQVAAAAPQPSHELENRRRLPDLLTQFSVLRTNRPFLKYELSYAFFGSGFVAIQAVVPIYLAREFDAAHTQATMAINTVPMLATALTLPLWGRLLDRYNPLLMRMLINGFWSLTPVLLFFATTIELVYAAQLIQGLVWSGSMLIWWLGVNYFARRDEVATYMTVHQTLTGLRGVITPFVGIWIAQWTGYRISMLLWFGLMAIGTAIMVHEVWTERRQGRLRSFSEAEAEMEAEAGTGPPTDALRPEGQRQVETG